MALVVLLQVVLYFTSSEAKQDKLQLFSPLVKICNICVCFNIKFAPFQASTIADK